MRTTHRIRPQLESLEGKALLSAGMTGASNAAAVVAPTDQTIHLSGTTRGSYVSHQSNPDAGKSYDLFGSGRVSHLGRSAVAGNLHTVGFIKGGQAEGRLFLASFRGTLTLKLTGEPKQDGPAPLPNQFDYTITDGSGRFADVKGSGAIVLTLDPGKSNPTPTAGAPTNGHGRFTLTFVS